MDARHLEKESGRQRECERGGEAAAHVCLPSPSSGRVCHFKLTRFSRFFASSLDVHVCVCVLCLCMRPVLAVYLTCLLVGLRQPAHRHAETWVQWDRQTVKQTTKHVSIHMPLGCACVCVCVWAPTGNAIRMQLLCRRVPCRSRSRSAAAAYGSTSLAVILTLILVSATVWVTHSHSNTHTLLHKQNRNVHTNLHKRRQRVDGNGDVSVVCVFFSSSIAFHTLLFAAIPFGLTVRRECRE